MSCISICVTCTDFSGHGSDQGWLFQLNLYHFAPCRWSREASPRNLGASSSPQEVEMDIGVPFHPLAPEGWRGWKLLMARLLIRETSRTDWIKISHVLSENRLKESNFTLFCVYNRKTYCIIGKHTLFIAFPLLCFLLFYVYQLIWTGQSKCKLGDTILFE